MSTERTAPKTLRRAGGIPLGSERVPAKTLGSETPSEARAATEPNPQRFPRTVPRQGLSFLQMEDFVVDVGPKLLKKVRSSVDRYIRQPELIGLGEGAV
jgi:hypothetical protein